MVIKNIGNVVYKDSTTINLENEDNKYILNKKLNLKTRDLGRQGIAEARAALANARLLPEVDLDAA